MTNININLKEYKKFLSNNGFFLRYKYKTHSKFFLERKKPYEILSVSDANCKVIDWFKNIKTKAFLSFLKHKFYEYANKVNLDLTTKAKTDKFYKELVDEHKAYAILGTSDVLYPFIKRGIKTLAIPNDIHSEILNRYYIYCIIHNVLLHDKKLFICLPNQDTLGQTHVDKSHSYTRYTTKELYTIFEFLKHFNELKHNKGNLTKFNYKIRVKKISNKKNKNFRLWILSADKKKGVFK